MKRHAFSIIERPPCKNVPQIFRPFFESTQNQLNFGMRASLHPTNTAPKFLPLGYSSLSRNNVCKKGTQVGKTEWFIAYAISRERSEL